jgi:hypothetical protein
MNIEMIMRLIKREIEEMNQGWQEGSVYEFQQLQEALKELEAMK